MLSDYVALQSRHRQLRDQSTMPAVARSSGQRNGTSFSAEAVHAGGWMILALVPGLDRVSTLAKFLSTETS